MVTDRVVLAGYEVHTSRTSQYQPTRVFDITAESDWADLVAATSDFREGVVARCEIVNGFVFDDGSLRAADAEPVGVVVACQFQHSALPAILLRFDDVTSFTFRRDQDDAGTCLPVDAFFREWRFLNCRVTARGGRGWVVGTDWLGSLTECNLTQELIDAPITQTP